MASTGDDFEVPWVEKYRPNKLDDVSKGRDYEQQQCRVPCTAVGSHTPWRGPTAPPVAVLASTCPNRRLNLLRCLHGASRRSTERKESQEVCGWRGPFFEFQTGGVPARSVLGMCSMYCCCSVVSSCRIR